MTTGHISSQFIYRYYRIDEYLYDSIVGGHVFFPNPNSFNDPFDTKIPTKTESSAEEYRTLIKDIDEKKQLTGEQIEAQIQRMLGDPQGTYAQLNNLLQGVIGKIGVACFSRISDNILMWSHYADKHKGVCFKYDIKKLFVPNQMRPLDVAYMKEYPDYNYFKPGNRESLANKIIGVKSVDWSYEQEIRILSTVQGKNSIDRSAVVEVLFGCKTELAKASIVITLLRQNRYDPEFKKAVKKSDSFGIYFEELEGFKKMR